jgi:hypothetical protein
MGRLQNNLSIGWVHPKSRHAHPLAWGNNNGSGKHFVVDWCLGKQNACVNFQLVFCFYKMLSILFYFFPTMLDEYHWSRSLSSIAPVASGFYLTPVKNGYASSDYNSYIYGPFISTSRKKAFQPQRMF